MSNETMLAAILAALQRQQEQLESLTQRVGQMQAFLAPQGLPAPPAHPFGAPGAPAGQPASLQDGGAGDATAVAAAAAVAARSAAAGAHASAASDAAPHADAAMLDAGGEEPEPAGAGSDRSDRPNSEQAAAGMQREQRRRLAPERLPASPLPSASPEEQPKEATVEAAAAAAEVAAEVAEGGPPDPFPATWTHRPSDYCLEWHEDFTVAALPARPGPGGCWRRLVAGAAAVWVVAPASCGCCSSC